jgi:hypothetical protein
MFLLKLQNSYLSDFSLSFSNNRQFRSRILTIDFRFRFCPGQKVYENKNNLAVFRSFSTIFIPTYFPIAIIVPIKIRWLPNVHIVVTSRFVQLRDD